METEQHIAKQNKTKQNTGWLNSWGKNLKKFLKSNENENTTD
jgi:hypothetical protein